MHLSNPCIYIKIKIKTFLVVVEERTFLKERKPSTRFFQGTPSAWEVGSFQHHSTLCFKTAYLTPFPCKKKLRRNGSLLLAVILLLRLRLIQKLLLLHPHNLSSHNLSLHSLLHIHYL